jgi:multidrug resistance efflux pump
MRTTLLIALVFGIIIGLGSLYALEHGAGAINFGAPQKAVAVTPATAPATTTPGVAFRPDRVAADGKVEGARPEVEIRPDVAGLLASVAVRENQDVSAGTLLAELENSTQKQRVAVAQAGLARARAQLVRLRNGERAERRKAAAAAEEARRVVLQQTKSDFDRSEKLAKARSASREEYDRSYFAMLRAGAELDEALAQRAEVEAAARPDDVAIEEGNVAAAEAQLRLTEAELAKTRILAPCDGRILQIFSDPGEQASPAMAQPILLLADLSKRRVRAFVEELDATRVEVGQRAKVTADGLPGREFEGTVALVMPRMGERGPRSDNPGEYKDVYFREALIDLDAGDELPINLRVQVKILASPLPTGEGGRRPGEGQRATTAPG